MLHHRGETGAAQIDQQLLGRDGGVAARRLGQEDVAQHERDSRVEGEEAAAAGRHGEAQTGKGNQQKNERGASRCETGSHHEQRKGRPREGDEREEAVKGGRSAGENVRAVWRNDQRVEKKISALQE